MSERFKTSAELLAEKCELLDRAEALSQLIETENREFSADEKAEFDRITGDSGELAAKAAEYDARVAYEAKRNALRDARAAANSQTPSWAGGPMKLPVEDQNALPRIEVKTPKSRIFADQRQAYACGQWLRASILGDQNARSEMVRFGGQEFAAQTAGTGSAGGYFVPQPMVTEIIRNRDEVGIAGRIARTVAMGSDTLQLPEESTRPTVYYVAEGATGTVSEGSFKKHTLIVSKRFCAVEITRELLADSAIAAADFVVEQMGYQFSYVRDNELLNANGTSTFGGEVGLISGLSTSNRVTASSGELTAASLDLAEWEATVAALPGLYHARNPVWIMSRATWFGSCLPLANALGGNTISMLQSGLGGLQWMGYPVVLSDLMPAAAASATAALFGAFPSAVTIGDRGDMRLESDASIGFLKDVVTLKMTDRYDVLVHNPSAYATLRYAAS
jgi:HK97 family phage major capsid protein